MTTAAQRASHGLGSDPPSGVRPPWTAADLGSFAQQQIKHAPRWARDLGVRTHDVEDLLQEAFVVLVEKNGTLRADALWRSFCSALRHKKARFLRAQAIAARFEPLFRAHVTRTTPPAAAPDAALLRRQALAAVLWLVEQVHKSRREVVERHVLDDEPLPQVAEATGVPPGTVFARWEDAKGDMREAIERERKKQGARRWLVPLAALVDTLCLLLLAKGRRVAGTLAELAERGAGRVRGLHAPRRARAGAAVWRGPGRRGAALAACMALAVAVHSHVPANVVPTPAALFAATLEAIAAEATREAHATRAVDRNLYAPMLTTNAERERERRDVEGRVDPPRPAPVVAAPVAHTAAPEASGGPAGATLGRGFLTRAASAIASGDLDVARDALRTYDGTFLGGPYDVERARLGALLSAAEGAR